MPKFEQADQLSLSREAVAQSVPIQAVGGEPGVI
jgi:hypothetical protein